MSTEYSNQAINSVLNSEQAFCKFLSANDTGATGGHQSGILISKSAELMLFSLQQLKQDGILKRTVKIRWQDDFLTESCFTYYESKNELRITRFGRGFPFLKPDKTGTLFVFTKQSEEDYSGLNDYELVIADLTGHNPNVFFEIGYRTKSQKPIIHLKRKDETIPFDISAIRTFEYDLTDLDMVTATKDRLEQVIKNFKYDEIKESKKSSNNFENNMIVASLNDIQYKIDVLTEEIKKKENETIKTVIETFNAQKPEPESLETEMMKILMPELIRNPNAADALLKLSDKFK